MSENQRDARAIGRIKLVAVPLDELKNIFHPNLWRFCDKLYSHLLDPLSVCSVTLPILASTFS